ncbi:3-phosphoshikimate 1-carboxyvinyltransferase [Pontibacillus salipaludis]|uniref:3-phosphoshikimate 1-carboxyvinyltransferase n=1 Tax=Pontibacillus salipaludis TaxID=1697394 RepID=A0ABQ1PM25_9BACI|nr:3-phosphoshikimate 1-carboxyvinyltransferase [Pontibacillus salipaludis]
MDQMEIKPRPHSLNGTIHVPGDKSISHRAIMLGSLAEGRTTVKRFLTGEDCLTTIKVFQSMGVPIEQNDDEVRIDGKGLHGLSESVTPLNLGNSGTTTRLLLGILAGTPNHYTLFGDPSLSKRPMNRVVDPLREMGALIDGREHGNLLPLSIRGQGLKPIHYRLPVNSAQVKSAILLAGLFANGTTTVMEPVKTRDHTERMLEAFGVKVKREGDLIHISGGQTLTGVDIEVPGDISSAAFFMCAAALKENSEITLKDVGLNPTRTGIVDVLNNMGVSMTINTTRHIGDEPVGDITVKGGPMHGTTLSGDLIPRLIDELPIIALVASRAEGKTIIKDAEELRYKETDRIQAVVDTLKQMGAKVEATKDGMIIEGSTNPLNGGTYSSYHDHRIGMMVAVASVVCEEKIILDNPSCISISYPNFFDHLDALSKPN